MAQVSPPLISLLSNSPTGLSAAFQPDFLYLMRIPRNWSSSILGLCMRAPVGKGSVAFVLVSDGQDDQKGRADEILFETELQVPGTQDANGAASLLVMFPEPVLYQETVWLGFRFSDPVQVPIRLPGFIGERTEKSIAVAELKGSLLNTSMVPLLNDEKLGMPILFPIYGSEEVTHGQ